MGLRDMYSAGDIIEYEGGGRDYLVSIEGEEGLWVNACNPSWVERGLRGFCDACHPFFADWCRGRGPLRRGHRRGCPPMVRGEQGRVSRLNVLRWSGRLLS